MPDLSCYLLYILRSLAGDYETVRTIAGILVKKNVALRYRFVVDAQQGAGWDCK